MNFFNLAMKLLATTILSILIFGCSTENKISQDIKEITNGKDLKLGVALYDFENNSYYAYNGLDTFPMQSVYKLPISIAILDLVDSNRFGLNDSITISKEDLSPNLYSPIRDKYPNGVKMPLSEIILYTIAQSDNTGCDLLISIANGTDSISKFLENKGLTNIKIRNYEREIQSDWNIQFDNWTTPMAMINLLKKLNNQELLSSQSTSFIWKVMTQSSTGSIKDLLPSTITAGYKTGYSGVGENQIIAAQNCVGIMQDGKKRIAFAIFITNSKESRNTNMEVIAKIGKMIYERCYK